MPDIKSESPRVVFLQKLASLRKRGLRNIKFFRARNGADRADDVYREVNRLLESKKVVEIDDL